VFATEQSIRFAARMHRGADATSPWNTLYVPAKAVDSIRDSELDHSQIKLMKVIYNSRNIMNLPSRRVLLELASGQDGWTRADNPGMGSRNMGMEH
jgi:hypothetical protein